MKNTVLLLLFLLLFPRSNPRRIPFVGTMDENQYYFELNHNDVLCGRGSGPNDRVGNIEFRNLVFTRKAEYLAAPSRDAKGHIASDIINAVRSRGGRFLKKLSPEQAIKAGFKRGTAIYELADVATVLEKTKQTLRQNRAEFVKENCDVVGVNSGGSSPVATYSNAPSPKPNNDVGQKMKPQPCPVVSSQTRNETSSSIEGSWNPLPVGASAGLNMSARIAELLSKVLSSTSTYCSSVTNPSFTNPNRVVENNDLANMSNKPHFNATEPTSSVSTNSANYSILSMDTAELCAAIGSGVKTSFNDMSFLDSSNASGTSAEAFGALLNEYNLMEETHLREMFERAKAESHLKAQGQPLYQNNINNQQNMHHIPKNQQVAGSQFYPPELERTNDQITSNTIESIKAQLLQQQRALQNHVEAIQQQNSTQLLQQQRALKNHIEATQQPNSSSNHYQSKNMQFIPEEAQVNFHQPQLKQDDQTHAANVFASLARQNTLDQMILQPQQELVGGLQQHEQTQQHTLDVLPITNNSDNDALMGSLLRRLSADDEQKLLQQFQQMQQEMLLQRQSDQMYQDSSVDSELPLNDSQPKQNQNSIDNNFAVEILGTFDPSRRRPSRQSSSKRDIRKVTTFCSDIAMNSSTASVEMLNVEPVDYSSTDESIRLSYLTANRLVETLNMSTTSMGMSGLWERRRSSNDLDCSMTSLQSLSLLEMPQDAHASGYLDVNSSKQSL